MILLTLILILGAGCEERPVKKTEQKLDPLSAAHDAYNKGNFQQSIKLFESALNNNNKFRRMQPEQARWGMIVSQILAGAPEWSKNLNASPRRIRGYWKGESFTILEGLSASERDYFREALQKPRAPLAHLLLVTFFNFARALPDHPFGNRQDRGQIQTIRLGAVPATRLALPRGQTGAKRTHFVYAGAQKHLPLSGS